MRSAVKYVAEDTYAHRNSRTDAGKEQEMRRYMVVTLGPSSRDFELYKREARIARRDEWIIFFFARNCADPGGVGGEGDMHSVSQ